MFGSGKAPGWISFDQARKSLAEIARLLKNATDEKEKESLRTFGHLLLGGFRYDPLLLALLKQFLTDEAIDLIPAWMQEEKKEAKEATPEGPPSPERRAADLLALAEESRIDALGEQGPTLVKELLGLKRFDLVGEIVKTLAEHARNVAPRHRAKAVKTTSLIYPLLDADEMKDARAALEGRVQAALALERDRGIYPALLELTVQTVESLVQRGRLEPAAPILSALRQQTVADDKEYVDRRETSFRALERLATGPVFLALLERVRAKHSLAIQMTESLGVAAAKGLVDRMKVSDSMAERISLAQLVLRAGPEAGNVLTSEVQQVLAPSEALKLVDLIRLAMVETQAEAALGMTLRHPALAVRRRAAAFLKGNASPRAGAYFLDALRKETDPTARGMFVEALGALRYDAGLPTLAQILEARSEPEDIRCAAAAALGNLGKPQAIPILTRASVKGRGLTLVLNAAPPGVRAACVRALAAYTHHGDARDALRRSLEDPDAVVRENARESLLSTLIKSLGDGVRRAALVSDADNLESSDGPVAGFLSEVPLDQVCQALEEGARTGLLLVNVGGSNAKVFLEAGDVVAAEYNGAKGQEAFNQFCRWEGTCFLFAPGTGAPNPGAPQSIIKMVMDACELRDRS